MAVRPARRQRRLPDRMTRFMLFLAHWMDYPPAGIRFGAALPPLWTAQHQIYPDSVGTRRNRLPSRLIGILLAE